MPTINDYLLASSAGSTNLWVRLTNNATSTSYVSNAATDSAGRFSITAPVGVYTVATGPTSSGAWTNTGDVAYVIADSLSNEAAACSLINATSTGDAGGRADHFLGTSLSGNWSVLNHAPATVTVGNSVVSVTASSGNNADYAQAYTPTGAFRMEARISRLGNGLTSGGNGGQGCYFSATDTTDQNEVSIEASGLNAILSSLDSGSYTQRAVYNVPTSGGGATYGNPPWWWYLRLDRDGSNNFTGYVSADRAAWLQVGTYTKTLSVAKMRIGGFDAFGVFTFDFVDVVS